jgi:hypothetical protein
VWPTPHPSPQEVLYDHGKPKEKWMSVEEFKKQKLAEGYKIRKFKQPGSCYEIYGTNKDGKNVEIYFNPVDGSVVKEEIE